MLQIRAYLVFSVMEQNRHAIEESVSAEPVLAKDGEARWVKRTE